MVKLPWDFVESNWDELANNFPYQNWTTETSIIGKTIVHSVDKNGEFLLINVKCSYCRQWTPANKQCEHCGGPT
jgi:hypothetical protein